MKRCINCNNIMTNDSKYCTNCGYPIVSFEDLKQLFCNSVGEAQAIQERDEYFNPTKYPLLHELKSKNIDFSSIIINDIFEWLLYLRTEVGCVIDEEVNFINKFFERPYFRMIFTDGRMEHEEIKLINGTILNLPYTKEEIDELITTKLNEDYARTLPMSIKFFYEYELYIYGSNGKHVFSDSLISTYEWLGGYFNAIDGNIYGPKRDLFNSYMNNLISNFDNFRLSALVNIMKE